MAKKRSKKRQRLYDQQKLSLTVDDNDAAQETEQTVSEEDLQVTVSTLNELSEIDYHKKICKPLRAALHPYYTRQLGLISSPDVINYPQKATVALQSGRWSDSLFYLKNCAIFGANATGDCVKNGTIQRWVRLCDNCTTRTLQLRLIRAILKCSKDCDESEPSIQAAAPSMMEAAKEEQVDHSDNDQDEDDDFEETTDDNIVSTEEWFAPIVLTKKDFLPTIVHRTLAQDRKPPNRHDLVIYSTPPHTINMEEHQRVNLQAHLIHPIPGAILLEGVLSPSECHQLMSVSESLSYQPDHPVTEANPTGIDACEWLVDPSILDPLVQRVLPHLPTCETYKVAGINARWRLFRYGNGGEYRPHVDGSWPKTSLNEDGTYTPPSKDDDVDRVRSRYTFLMYLNDGFDGGTTTFYLPADGGREGLKAVKVRPKAGAVLMFPQGNTASLVHEGAQVTAGGYKYVIRSDVLYEK